MSPVSNPSPNVATPTNGSYTGNDAANRAIPHGLGQAPRLVVIWLDSSYMGMLISGINKMQHINAVTGTQDSNAVTAVDSTNFHVGNAGDYSKSMNASGGAYKWVAIP